MADVNLRDAQVAGVSAQGRYEFAYNAARLTATMVIRAGGYRVTARGGHHYYTFVALEAADPGFSSVAVYFDDARNKRNDFLYDAPIPLSDSDVADLVDAVKQFRKDAEAWVAAKDPKLA